MTSIGLFTYSTKPRGSVVHATYLAEALTARGHDVTLYALSKAGDRLYREVSCKVVYLPAAEAPSSPDALIAQRIREIAEGVERIATNHDVYHAEDCLVASGLVSARGALGRAPLIRTLHHLEHFESPYLQECQRRSILEADAVACVSEVSQRDVRTAFGRVCSIIGNGVDVARFAPDAERLRWGRARFEVAEGDAVALSVGGVEPRKNSLSTLRAMVRVLRAHPALRWFIAGGASIWEHDAYRAEFRANVDLLETDVRSRVVQLGPMPERELTVLYEMSQILLCPSLQEGFGLCVLEAMAAGTAVVVSNREPFTEYLAQHEACFVEPESPFSIAEAVERLCSDAELCATLAKAGRARVEEFSWERVAALHERLYRSVLPSTASFAHVYEEPAHA